MALQKPEYFACRYVLAHRHLFVLFVFFVILLIQSLFVLILPRNIVCSIVRMLLLSGFVFSFVVLSGGRCIYGTYFKQLPNLMAWEIPASIGILHYGLLVSMNLCSARQVEFTTIGGIAPFFLWEPALSRSFYLLALVIIHFRSPFCDFLEIGAR